MKLRRITGVIAAATLTAATLVGVPLLAHATPAGDVESQTVPYGDLNLSSEAGVAALYRRIQVAARNVCGNANFTGSRIVSQDWKDCVSESVRHAVLSINRPQVTSYYADRLRVPVSRTAG